MKNVLKLEELGMLLLFALVYFHFYPESRGLYAGLFFAPDLAFLFYLISPNAGSVAYNILHHKGVMAILILAGIFLGHALLIQIGLIFMAHSCFDRVFGYGLKYPDAFAHTHLGWIGKNADLKKEKE